MDTDAPPTQPSPSPTGPKAPHRGRPGLAIRRTDGLRTATATAFIGLSWPLLALGLSGAAWAAGAPVAGDRDGHGATPLRAPITARAPTAAPDCGPGSAGPSAPTLPAWQPLGGGAWWLPGAAGDTQGHNRGAISNLLAVREDAPADGGPARLWLVGSGPSPVIGRALADALRCQVGLSPTDVIAPWSRPELVLGVPGLAAADRTQGLRHWAHADVIAAMAERCPRCIERLRLRLAERGGDLDGVRVDLPGHALSGASGTLGPLRWWRVSRGDTALTWWWHPASGVLTGHGLLWDDGAPDLRDTDIGAMLAALDAADAVAALAGAVKVKAVDPADGEAVGLSVANEPARGGEPAGVGLRARLPGVRWLPEQGPLAEPASAGLSLLDRHRRYWQALQAAVEHAQAIGAAETDPPPAPPGVDTAWLASPRHALNWQRAWRQVEAAWAGGEQAGDAAAANAAHGPNSANGAHPAHGAPVSQAIPVAQP